MNLNQTVVTSLLFCCLFSACKKDEVATATAPVVIPPVTPERTPDEVLKDSIQLLTRGIYLWNTQLPASFNARDYATPVEIMEAIRPYSIEPGFAQPVDRFSFAIKQTEWDNMSAGMSTLSTALGATGDLGLTVFFRTEGDLRVRMVEPNSPAGKAGVERGWRVTSIAGSNNITTANADFIVDKIYNTATVAVGFKKPDGSSVELTFTQATYATTPVYLDTVYTVNNKKIGYLVFNSFLGVTTQLYSELQGVFNRFGNAQVDELVIDLRYNGGGYVAVQQRIANYIANSGANGGVMMKQEFNAANSARNVTARFSKMGSLELKRVYFIVGRSTASASELLINNLKPYMDVRLIGNVTSGKPVGYSPIPVGEWYILPVSFRTTNKNGEGNYYNGINVNHAVADGLDKDWGDLNENCLASAIRNISTGSYRASAAPPYLEPARVAEGNAKLDAPLLKLTVADQ